MQRIFHQYFVFEEIRYRSRSMIAVLEIYGDDDLLYSSARFGFNV